MKPEEMRVAVANALDWKFARIELASCGGAVYEDVWFPPGFNPSEQTADWIAANGCVTPPNYPESLDACAEFEATLKPCRVSRDGTYPPESKKWGEYVMWLLRICERDGFTAVGAPPLQRCEAFLRVKGVIK